MHFQRSPHAETKLVSCLAGAVYDVAIDLRRDSPTRGKWFGAELTAENRRALYVPEGCAHGYLTLVEDTEVEYPVTAFYRPDAERGLRWNDPAFAIEWPDAGPLTLSSKDEAWPDYCK